MKLIALVAALAAVLVHAGSAQTGCIEARPVKPVTPVGCLGTSLLCLCGPNGTYCHWEWVCVPLAAAPPANRSTAPTATPPQQQTGIDPGISLAYRPPVIDDPVEAAIRLEQLRRLQQQQGRMRGKPLTPENLRKLDREIQKMLEKETKKEAALQRKQEKLAKQIEREEAAKRAK
jgi:hypothetical protein